jgi:Patatin-like phospholipase
MAFGDRFQFLHVFRSEVASINKRRAKTDRPPIKLEDEKFEGERLTTSDGSTPERPTEQSQIVGLSLSGGGIRSAAFCLGALQALREADVLSRVDYLSTVSGGGYIGSSVSGGMSADGGRFPFRSELSEDETPSLQHVRDYSNYLFPDGAGDFLWNASIYLRGLAANAILVLPFLLFAAFVTILSKPVANESLGPNLLGFKIPNIFSFDHFVVTTYLGLFLLAVIICWGIQRSLRCFQGMRDFPSAWTRLAGTFVLIVLISAFCELQPFILDAMFDQTQSGFLPAFIAWIKSVALVLAPVATIVAFVARKFGEVVKSALESERVRDQVAGYAARAAIYVAAAIVPILLWALYLQFSYWGICLRSDCTQYMAPDWLSNTAHYLTSFVRPRWSGENIMAAFYLIACLACLFVALFLRPNANSLHTLYRDRLSKAFLFMPQKTVPRDGVTGVQKPLDSLPMKLSGLSEVDAPYHLINTALNVQASKEVNRRGRNADFFLFSRNFVGSKATDYVATKEMEKITVDLDLGTAMAVSGAAASSNMGAATIKPLTPTIALLNIRLAYWLRNPKQLAKSKRGWWNRFANFYFLLEMFGGLDENRKSVYLTDGGHIENLGIYELLRRRCKVIIAIDAEADPQMAFGSFNVLERHALIDLGVRIDLPWQEISNVTKATSKKIDETGDCPRNLGPHAAVGEILYPGDRKGILIYIKSSLTGDENDYVFHYKKRYDSFPHETTLDQLFSEEQFEAYRALGFHAAHRFFDRRDKFAHLDPTKNLCVGDDIKFLDQFFPLVAGPNPCWPREHATFFAWLAADTAAETKLKIEAKEAAASAAKIAAAAGEIAAAAMTATGQAPKRKKGRRSDSTATR